MGPDMHARRRVRTPGKIHVCFQAWSASVPNRSLESFQGAPFSRHAWIPARGSSCPARAASKGKRARKGAADSCRSVEASIRSISARCPRLLLPGLCCFTVTQCLQNWLAAQRVTRPGGSGGMIMAALYLPLCWLLVRKPTGACLDQRMPGLPFARHFWFASYSRWRRGVTFHVERQAFIVTCDRHLQARAYDPSRRI